MAMQVVLGDVLGCQVLSERMIHIQDVDNGIASSADVIGY